MIAAAPGDVLAVLAGGPTWFAKAILAFERMAGKPAVSDHVVILTHRDPMGRWMGIEGRPSGVGLVDATAYLADSATRSNHDQPRDPAGLPVFLASCAKTLGVKYDWVGIGVDALAALHVYDLSEDLAKIYAWPTQNNVLPGHFVCSSLAAWLYELVGWAHPGGSERMCEPADWVSWSDGRGWDG